MRRLAVAATASAVLAVGGAPESASGQPVPCGVWVVRNALESPLAWRAALGAVERSGCRRMYLQVSGRWDSFFPSRVFPLAISYPRAIEWRDPFGDAVVEARARGIEVHAWVNALIAWSSSQPPPDPDHVYRRRPDWFVVGPGGRSIREASRAELDRSRISGWFLDPAQEGVRTELRRFILEVATRYPIDGIHLDYIRYPTGWAPVEGADAVTRLVRLIRRDLDSTKSSLVLSAAVLPRPKESLSSFGQEWDRWLAEGIIDEVIPMVYRRSASAITGMVRGYPQTVPRERVLVGIRIDRISAGEARQAARRLREDGVAGVVLFSHNLLIENPGWREGW